MIQTPVTKKKPGPLAWILILSASFFFVVMVVSTIFVMSKGGSNVPHRGGKKVFSDDAVGVIELKGVIMDSRKFLRQFEELENDERVKAIVVRLNSPGGSVAPSQEIYQAVKKAKKPVVASMASVAASGAFYVAMGAKKVYANAGTLTGSIGVIMEFANLEKLYDWAKIKRYVIKTGKFKDAGAEYRDMTAEERELLSTMVFDVLRQFKEAVAEGRKLPMEKVDAVADGRIFSGAQAKQAALVDELGTLDDAVHDAAKIAGIKGEPAVLRPERSSNKIWDFVMDHKDEDEDAESSSSIGKVVSRLENKIEGLSPGVYWLWTAAR